MLVVTSTATKQEEQKIVRRLRRLSASLRPIRTNSQKKKRVEATALLLYNEPLPTTTYFLNQPRIPGVSPDLQHTTKYE